MPIKIPVAKSESEFSSGLTKLLRNDAAAEVMAIVGGTKQTAGWPDRFVSHCQFAGFIEVKCDDYGLDERQQAIIETLNRNHACTAFVLICSRARPMSALWLLWPSCSMQCGVFNKVSSDTWMKQDITHCTDVVMLLKLCGQIQSEERDMQTRARRLALHKQLFKGDEREYRFQQGE